MYKRQVSALTELVARFSQRLDVLKAERNILDFSDLEQLALKLLVEQDGADIRKTELEMCIRDRNCKRLFQRRTADAHDCRGYGGKAIY